MSTLAEKVVESFLNEPSAQDAPVEVVAQGSASGGCISEAGWIEIAAAQSPNRSGRFPDRGVGHFPRKRLFWKHNSAELLGNFQAEADGLTRLAAGGTIRTPEIHGVGLVSGRAHLLMEWIDRGERIDYVKFGESLAKHHQATAGQSIGLPIDNFLGTTDQPNRWDDRDGGWEEFFVVRRLEPQVAAGIDDGDIDGDFARELNWLMDSIGERLSGREDTTSLLHGDLWSGNFWSDPEGNPVWIDPAVYHGCREAEFGMIELFGGCPPEFTTAYQSVWPMPDGWKRRVDVYVLYHLLNHLNLFGAGYLAACEHRVETILAS